MNEILFSGIVAVLLLWILRLRTQVKLLRSLCDHYGLQGYKLGVRAEKERTGLPVEERERLSYIQGLRDANAVWKKKVEAGRVRQG